MAARTQEDAKELLCPFARPTDASFRNQNCIGARCALWRWQPLPASIIAPAVKAHMAEAKAAHKDAVAYVMENRAALGIPTEPTHGYCGGGGQT